MPSEFQFKEAPLALEIQFKERPLPSEFQKAIRRGVWIFSGIAHFAFCRVYSQKFELKYYLINNSSHYKFKQIAIYSTDLSRWS